MGMMTILFIGIRKPFDKELSYEEELIAILAKDVRKLRTQVIPHVKVYWRNRIIEEATWDTSI